MDWIETLSPNTASALVGLTGGLMLGLAARLGRFCTLGALEDALYAGDWLRLRMWGVAIGTAVIGFFALIGAGMIDPGDTFYLGLHWYPAAAILGGLTFGYGMALAGNCPYGALSRLGGGDLRGFVILVVTGLAAGMTMGGPLGWLRDALIPSRPFEGEVAPGLAHALAALWGLDPAPVGMAIGALILIAALASPAMRARPAAALWGVVVGLAVVVGWAGTAWVAEASFGAVQVRSYSFSAPLSETMIWLMTATGQPLGFGVGSVAGVIAGALIGSIRRGHFRWEACEDPRELRRQIAGSMLMGIGAVVAIGCSIGQGLTAFSTLAWSAPITLGAIFIGAALGLRQLIAGAHAV
ncbi:MAG: YeeE/YedE family protein [Alphaproteobacteria bacterium]|nr:MAG: YeeE/YedE family protein [Alphaproteobacteria bacterium]